MLGNQFGGETFNSDYIVQNASNWVYAGTGWTNGTHVPGLVGYEYNHYFGDSNTPPGTVVLSNTPLVNTENGNQPDTANATIYTAPSGARVFSAATIQWSWGLDNYGGTSMVNAGVQRVTQNIIDNFTARRPAAAADAAGRADRRRRHGAERRGRADRGRRRPRTAARRSPATASRPPSAATAQSGGADRLVRDDVHASPA